MNLPPPPQGNDPIITQFHPADIQQWQLNDDNIKRIEPKTGQTILHNYCEYINTTPLPVYRYLIETMSCDINLQDKNKNTPLHQALKYCPPIEGITVLMYLLNRKNVVNCNTKGEYGSTFLHMACININSLPLNIFELLIETMGADVNVQDKYNDTPLHYAIRGFNRQYGGDITVLTYLLSQKGINVNIKGWHGNTLLHTACDNINIFPLEIFKVLIETQGFDVNQQGEYNDTPLHRAFEYFKQDNTSDIAVLTYLLTQENVNVNIKGKNGRNVLHMACISNLSHSWDSAELNTECDTTLCQIVEMIIRSCVRWVLDETTS
jgi:ankyrin repeat protein